MDFINYAAMDLKRREQFGSDEKVSANQDMKDFDYTDGLSKKELETIDKNKDGAISEEEFKAAFGGSNAEAYRSYWDSYKSFYNATSKKTQTGTETVHKKDDGTIVTSKYDKDGNLISYLEESKTDIGATEKVKYKYINGKEVPISRTKEYSDGSQSTVNLEKEELAVSNVDGSKCIYDKDGKLLNINISNSFAQESCKFKYNDKGELASVEINGTKYSNIEVKDGTTVIKDKDGNVVAKLTEDGSKNIYFTRYENGKKASRIKMNSDGVPENVSKYDKNGKLASRFFCEYNQLREYEYDASGNLTKSVDYRNNKKYSEQEYSDLTQKDVYGDNKTSSRLWSKRTYFDEKGNVKSYKTYDYTKKDADKNATQTVTYYDVATDAVTKKVTSKKDEYANTVSKKTYDKDGNEVSTSFYEYDVENIDRELTDKHIKKITTTEGSKTTTDHYEEGVLLKKQVLTMSDGKATKETYQYKYHTNGQEKEITKTIEFDDTEATEVTEFNENGEKISQKIDITAFLKSKYPDLTSNQIRILIRNCQDSAGNSFTSNSLVKFDISTSTYDIKIPEFRIEDGKIKF